MLRRALARSARSRSTAPSARPQPSCSRFAQPPPRPQTQPPSRLTAGRSRTPATRQPSSRRVRPEFLSAAAQTRWSAHAAESSAEQSRWAGTAGVAVRGGVEPGRRDRVGQPKLLRTACQLRWVSPDECHLAAMARPLQPVRCLGTRRHLLEIVQPEAVVSARPRSRRYKPPRRLPRRTRVPAPPNRQRVSAAAKRQTWDVAVVAQHVADGSRKKGSARRS